MERDKFYLVIAFLLSLLVTLVSFLLTLFDANGNRKKIMLNLLSAIIICGAAIVPLKVGWESISEKKQEEFKYDSIAKLFNHKQDAAIENLKTALELSRIEIDSTLKVLDTAKAILRVSVKSNLLQREISNLQSEVYNQLTGPTRVERRCFSYLMLNKEKGKPVLLELGLPLSKEDPHVIRLLDGFNYVFERKNEADIIIGKGPLNVFNTSLLDLYQYRLLNDMLTFQKSGMGLICVARKGASFKVIGVDSLRIRTIGQDDLKKIMKCNSYFTDAEDIRFKNDFLVLPKGAQIKISTEKGNDAPGSECRKIIIYKKGYFEIVISVDGEMELGSVNKFSMLHMEPDLLNQVNTYAFHISMDAHFYRTEMGEGDEYKQWVIRLFDYLVNINSI